MAAMTDIITERRAIEAMKFVRVALKDGYLTDVSIAMLLVELERRGVKLAPNPPDDR